MKFLELVKRKHAATDLAKLYMINEETISKLNARSTHSLMNLLENLRKRNTVLRESVERHTNPEYRVLPYVIDTVEEILESRKAEILKPIRDGIYYKDVVQIGDLLEGKVCSYPESFTWKEFSVPVLEAKIRYLAERKLLPVERIMDHTYSDTLLETALYGTGIVKSVVNATPQRRKFIENELDAVMESLGEDWPWYADAPENVKFIMESREMLSKRRYEVLLENIKSEIGETVVDIDPETGEKFEIVEILNTMSARIDGMFGDIGKLTTDSMNLVVTLLDQGEDTETVKATLRASLDKLADALADVKISLNSLVSNDDTESPVTEIDSELVSDMVDEEPDAELDIGDLEDVDLDLEQDLDMEDASEDEPGERTRKSEDEDKDEE